MRGERGMVIDEGGRGTAAWKMGARAKLAPKTSWKWNNQTKPNPNKPKQTQPSRAQPKQTQPSPAEPSRPPTCPSLIDINSSTASVPSSPGAATAASSFSRCRLGDSVGGFGWYKSVEEVVYKSAGAGANPSDAAAQPPPATV